MSNEFDYSGLYNHTPQDKPQQDTASAAPEAGGETPPQTGYPNVGSSGMNTANTARTDYSTPQQEATPPRQDGYTSSFSGGSGGGYNGYSYASAPQQPPKKENRGGKKVLLRVVAGIGVLALGFAGGFGGAIVASRTGLTGNQVVVQQVQRDTSSATNTNSTSGETMSVQ